MNLVSLCRVQDSYDALVPEKWRDSKIWKQFKRLYGTEAALMYIWLGEKVFKLTGVSHRYTVISNRNNVETTIDVNKGEVSIAVWYTNITKFRKYEDQKPLVDRRCEQVQNKLNSKSLEFTVEDYNSKLDADNTNYGHKFIIKLNFENMSRIQF